MNIDIKGHSGCNIDIVEIDNKLYIRKSSKDKKYLDRLYNQGLKQRSDTGISSVSIPHVYELEKNYEETYILMDYIYAKNYIDYFEHASPDDIKHFINTLIEYINNELQICDVSYVDKSIFVNKMKSVAENCNKNELLQNNEAVTDILNRATIIYDNLPDVIELPVGKCHGDLTFSNILFTNNNFYFIDYLDSFIETPIQDIVKIRQDTSYMWSTLMYDKDFDEIRLKMISNYIDRNIDEYFEKNTFYRNTYKILELLNMLRILPYVKEERVRDYLITIINEIINNYER